LDEKLVTIEKIVFGGKGLTRDLGKVTLVPFTIPGEKVRVRITREHRDYLEGEVLEIVEPSRERVAPDCRYFGHCGGCQLSHANYATQVKWKEAILRETYERNHLPLPRMEVMADQPFHYRHRARLQYDSRSGAIGFCERESNRVVNINECLCLTPALNDLLSGLQKILHTTHVAKLKEIDCFENDRGETALYFDAPLPEAIRKSLDAETRVMDKNDQREFDLSIHFRNYELPMRPDIFLQVNPKLWKAMIQEVESHYLDHNERMAIELYCGAGFFTVPLAKHFDRVLACEENDSAIAYAKKKHQIANVEWVRVRAEDFRFPSTATALIVDPPRAGLSKSLIKRVVEHPFRKISYISCDCTSLTRDLKILSERFSIGRTVLFDLFPQTFHFETITLLESKN
jgi:23S rRNA (uracil1939-C5)-methyltransferase